MNTYFDNPTYFEYLLKHCTGDIPADGEGRIAGARQLLFFLDRLDLKPQHKVLEVGCGTGRVLSVLAGRYGVEPHGVDPCSDAIAYLHKQRPDWAERISYVPDGVLTGLQSHFFDRVVFWGVFELTDQVRTLVEVSRATKPGARILLNGVRNIEYLENDSEMADAVAAYREKKIPIKLSRIDLLESLMTFLGFSIDDRFVFRQKADVVQDKFEADRKLTRFAEATYLLTKSRQVPADLEVAKTAY
jgi:SAM-dependent methyltransferase